MIVNLVTYSDTDFVQSFVYKTALSVPIDLTNYSLRMAVRQAAADPSVEFECTTHNQRVFYTDAAVGAFTLLIPVAVLLILPPGTYQQSMIATSPEQPYRRKDLWRGTLVHAAGPTRWELGIQ